MIAAIFGAILSGGGGFILSLLGTVAPTLATALGDVFIKAKQTQVESDKVGATVATGWLASVNEANRARAEARKNEGAWGPLGIATFIIMGAFAVHLAAVVADSLPLLPRFTWGWGFVPWIDLGPHSPCLCVVALPDKIQDVELEVARGLAYVSPPAAAAVVVAKAFRK